VFIPAPAARNPFRRWIRIAQLYKEFSVLDEAMSWARHLNKSGRVALLIEGDDGTRLTRQQIATALKSPETGDRDHLVA
jgi:hypothetical protein